ncbi:MAG: YkgJ family cysteine cluster protein [Gammaproteobacteria bacterium]|nr:YkgJ family cysteine cluster protein [Gammaproteobacteria bacterium]
MQDKFDFSDLLPKSPVTPIKLGLDDTFGFSCHKGIACFNRCCQSIDITLMPYDVLRLKNLLGLKSFEFLHKYTVPFEMDGHGMPGLKLRTRDDTAACQFVTEEGCSVYSDRPTACRYYALGMMSMRPKDSPHDEDHYFVVREDHCLGHLEPRHQTIRDYRTEQGVDVYDDMNREWRQIILKKRSCGPTIGKPSDRSFQLFFMCSYDLDSFREFVKSPSFATVYEIEQSLMEAIMADEVELMKFGFRFLKQALFGENTIQVRPDALEIRAERRRKLIEQQRQERRHEAESAPPPDSAGKQ